MNLILMDPFPFLPFDIAKTHLENIAGSNFLSHPSSLGGMGFFQAVPAVEIVRVGVKIKDSQVVSAVNLFYGSDAGKG
jgi:hypothetical protein